MFNSMINNKLMLELFVAVGFFLLNTKITSIFFVLFAVIGKTNIGAPRIKSTAAAVATKRKVRKQKKKKIMHLRFLN